MTEASLFALVVNLVYAGIAVAMVLSLLTLFNKLRGSKFNSTVYPKIISSPQAAAHYHGAIVIGICLLVGLMLGTK